MPQVQMKLFLRAIAIFLIPIALIYGLFTAILIKSGELIPVEQIVEKTLENETNVTLFGLGYRDETRAYKHAMASKKSAELLVLGTSRSMQFRGEFFETDSFYNAGGALPFLPQALAFLSEMPKESLPTNLILVLDQYFFNDAWASVDNERDYAPYQLTSAKDIDFVTTLRRVMEAFVDGKYNIFAMLQNKNSVVGMAAASRESGFYADGSYSYGIAVDNPEESNDYNFKDTFNRIAQNTNRFEYGSVVSEYHIEITRQILAFCAQNNIEVTAIIPPYATSVWEQMQASGNYTYIENLYPTLKPIFAEYNFEIFDYTYLPQTTDDMYIDGFHGSDRVYAYICTRLFEDSTSLAKYLNIEKLTAIYNTDGNPLTVDLSVY